MEHQDKLPNRGSRLGALIPILVTGREANCVSNFRLSLFVHLVCSRGRRRTKSIAQGGSPIYAHLMGTSIIWIWLMVG